ncbi:MAG TPA: hypothetical protein VN903_29100 [Polyangia bacterium]|jgi:hypothetical protein|nr:hypothetical protein [Polyangia bacterium]
MRLGSLSWNNNIADNTLDLVGPIGTDIHVLRGAIASPDLTPFLQLNFEAEPGDTSAAHDPIFASQLGDLQNAALALLLKNGRIDFETTFTLKPEHRVRLDPLSGEVTPLIPSASDIAVVGGRLENMLVRAVATRAGDDSTVVLEIRVHFHDEIDPAHLTLSPTALTVRVSSENFRTNRFGVLAQFDDGVVGDVSLSAGNTWSLLQRDATGALVPVPQDPTTHNFDLSEGGDVVLSMSQDGRLMAFDDFTSDVFVQCGISLRLGQVVQTPPAQVFSGGLWSDPISANPLTVRFIDGDGFNRLDEVTNVLILPDGFRDQDEKIFDEFVRRLVGAFRSDRSADPYRRFLQNRSINFFSSFIPSREFGCSVFFEMAPVVEGALYNTLPNSVRPPVSAKGIEHLVYIVGLPVPADQNLTINDAITRWGKMFGDAFTATVPVSVLQPGPDPTKQPGLFALWKNLAGRTLAVEHDTAFGIGVGERPNASTGTDLGSIGFNRFRATMADMRQHLSTTAIVKDSFGTQIPALWKTPEPTDTGLTGKDETHVIILAAGVPQVGTTHEDSVSIVGLGVAIRPVFTRDFVPPPSSPPDGWRIVDVDPREPTAEVFKPLQGVVLHELSHTLFLDDEYGGSDDPPSREVLFQTQISGNIVLDSTVRGPDPVPGQPFDMTKTMWGAVPRIRAAGVLTQTPEKMGSQYRITLRRGHADAFKNLGLNPGDLLLLRARPLLRAIFILTHPDPHHPLAIPPDFTIGVSPALAFQGFDSSGGSDDALLVTVAGGATLSGAFNVPGPVPFCNPVLLAPRVGADGKALTILSPAVAAHIAAVTSPTSRKPGVACVSIDSIGTIERDITEDPPDPARSMPASVINAVTFLSKVVGLYDKGATVDCGVYHPTGYCAMRNSSHTFLQKTSPFIRVFRGGGTREFCYVCRYLLIDAVDPTLHGEFDDQYSQFYVVTP